ncbi:MAG: DegT/DnrJ/EryC1/StrS family aminotransferase [Mariniphaga sp.]|nr:DegT/DnrJ/EryC1/StrS family aminotransferase [Mariniphaga sp.]
MNKCFIPVNEPLLNGNEKKYLIECIDTGWISSEGYFVKKFEDKFSEYLGCNEGIAVASGSGALDIAVKALKIGPNDEVIVPTFTIISPVQSIIRAGAIPILIDSDPITWNMNVTLIEAKITPKTKAILVVHIYGLPVDMEPILELCKKYNLYLIEDAAEMHGQTYNGRLCGSFGDISIFSFYPNKHITTGEGGMIMVYDHDLANRCRKLRNLAFEINCRRFIHKELGWNYRMTNLQAAIGLAQLENIQNHIEKKRWIGTTYNKYLKDITKFQLPQQRTPYAENIYWVYGLMAETEEISEKAQKFLNKNGIGTRPFFWCMHEQPIFKDMGFFRNEVYPNAEKMARNGFYIPSGLGITKDQIKHVVDVLKSF